MGLHLTNLELRDFRNYEFLHLDTIGDLNVFVGPNAAGKSNVLESIQLVSALSSFRHAPVEQLVLQGKDAAFITAEMEGDNRSLELKLNLSKGKREYILNGKKKRVGDLKGLLPAVVFTPDDLQLAKKSSSLKRTAIDDLGAQINKNYHQIRKDYEKVIRYKNKLLEEAQNDNLIASINETLITCATQLSCYRMALFKRLVEHTCKSYRSLSSGTETFDASYFPSWDKDQTETEYVDFTKEQVRASLEEHLALFFETEKEKGKSIIGPHADQIIFKIDGRNISQYASQGQQRSVVLAWKTAEVLLIEEKLHEKPLLLLDDVMSELDGNRRKALIDFVGQGMQTFITTTDIDTIDERLLSDAAIIELPQR